MTKVELYAIKSIRDQLEDASFAIQDLKYQLPKALQDKLTVNFTAAYTELSLLCAALYQELETYE